MTRTYSPVKTRNYETLVKESYLRECKGQCAEQDEAVFLKIDSYMKIPTSVSKKKKELMLTNKKRPLVRPDVDNIEKIVLDALQGEGLMFRNDSQVVCVISNKWYSENARVEVEAWTDGLD